MVIGTAQNPLVKPGLVVLGAAAGPAGCHDKGAILGIAPLFAAMRKMVMPGRMGSERHLDHGTYRLRWDTDMFPVAGELRRANHLLHGNNRSFAGGKRPVSVAHKGHIQDGIPFGVG